jgi:hypothetical protein
VALAVPRLGAIGEGGEGPQLFGPGLGPAHLEVVARGRRQGLERPVARPLSTGSG